MLLEQNPVDIVNALNAMVAGSRFSLDVVGGTGEVDIMKGVEWKKYGKQGYTTTKGVELRKYGMQERFIGKKKND